MSNVPAELKFTEEHEWAKIDGNIATIGISDYAQHELGDIVYVELPEVDDDVVLEDQFGEIEAVKTVAPLNSPVSGKIIEVNEALADNAGIINEDPYVEGWIVRIEMSDPSQLDNLMTSDQYKEKI